MKRGHPRLPPIPVRSLVPNILTLLAMSAGLTAVRLAFLERWEHAVFAIILAGVLDGLDGRIARLLKGTSKFGAELDSLSDVIAFGVAPAMVGYLWSLHQVRGIGWVLALAFCVCCALRLARFNTVADDPDKPDWTVQYFIGAPAPIGAGIAVLPLILDFGLETDFFRIPAVSGAFMIASAFLMVSRVPTYSFKRIGVRRDYMLPVLIAVGLFAAMIASFFWITVAAAGLLYLGSILFAVRSFYKQAAAAADD
jgi:CDP-diacylglycerol--serine O-phosphatidyltransferase